MILRILIVLGLVIFVPACGTKSELDLPNGKPPPHNVKDPSQPTSPIVR